MKRYRPMLMGLAGAVIGLAATFIYAPVGVAIATLAALLAYPKVFTFNVPVVRLITLTTIACYGGALAVATGSPILVAAGTTPLVLAVPHRWLVVMGGYRWSQILPVAMVLGVVLTLLAWPPSWWWLAALAPTGFVTMFLSRVLQDSRRWTRQNRAAWGVCVGDEVEDFRLPSRRGGEDFVLSDERGRWVLLQFARSDWCPVCHVMTRVLKKVADRAGDENVRIVLVSPQDSELDDVTIRGLGLTYTVVSDADHTVADRFGVIDDEAYGGKGAPVPAIFLIDPDGVLRMVSNSKNVAKLPDPATFLRVITEAS